MLTRLVYLLPTVTIIMAILNIVILDGYIPWVILFLPIALYSIYFVYGLISAVREAEKACSDKEDIDITFR